MVTASVRASEDGLHSATDAQPGWQSPPEEVLEVMHAQSFSRAWTAPTGEYLLIAEPVLYPPLSELAAPMHKLAGIRVNPVTNGHHGRHGSTAPRLIRVADGVTTPLVLPAEAEVYDTGGLPTVSASPSS